MRARCQSPTEPIAARLRLAHLFQTVDMAPMGMPPHAILLIRRMVSPRQISLTSLSVRSQWERAMREEVTRLYRRAVRPVRGIVPAGAEAVLFDDLGGWLACLGIAVQTRVVEGGWLWRTVLQTEAVSSSLVLARAWANTPRFVPAAIARLAEWGRLAGVLELFSLHEVSDVFAALANEWSLPEQTLSMTNPAGVGDVQSLAATERDSIEHVSDGGVSPRQFSERSKTEENWKPASTQPLDLHQHTERRTATLRNPCLRQALESCAQLPLETQRLAVCALALFHAPASVRSASFADEINGWPLSLAKRREVTKRRTRESGSGNKARKKSESPKTSPPNGSSLIEKSRASSVAAYLPHTESRVTAIGQKVTQETAEGLITGVKSRPTREEERGLAWDDLPAFRTEIGGVFFLINLIRQMELPECFDEEFHLSEHISGWGLAELLGKALLGPLNRTFRDDPLWTILARLDGRSQGEIPAATLPELAAFRIPVKWLERFTAPNELWAVRSALHRFRIYHHSGAFVLVDCPIGALTIEEQAAVELERYRSQGIKARWEKERSRDQIWRSSFHASLKLISGWSELPDSLRYWMGLTFPFLRYLLVGALGAERCTPEGLARLLLVKTGTLYCTATHVDLVMNMDQINLAVRRAALDANPGWQRNLMRVVSFHFE
jgi:hypothetical protein